MTEYCKEMTLIVLPFAQRSTAGNRDAQRAFRERKTEYVASLEARIEAYEKGEINRNVALQVSARATKEENVRLKAELDSRTQELASKDDRCKKLEKVVVELRRRLNAATEVARKLSAQAQTGSRGSSSASRRGSDAFSTILSASSPTVSVSSENSKMDMPISPPDYDRQAMIHQSSVSSHFPPPTRTYSSSHLAQQTDGDYQAMSDSQTQYHRMQARAPASASTQFAASIEVKTIQTQACGSNGGKSTAKDDFVPCGFCSGMESICVCRSIEENDKTLQDTSLSYFDKSHSTKQSFQPQSGIDSIVNAAKHQEAVSQSILENLPAPEAAVPLRRRRTRASGTDNSAKAPIFAVQPVNFDVMASRNFRAPKADASGIFTSASSGFESGVVAMMQDKENGLYIPPAECSGDPKNCPACKDDDFGTWIL
jgi:AP-1-like factor